MKFFIINRFFSKALSGMIVFIFLACGSSRNTGPVENFEELRALVNSREFEIESDWVNPFVGTPIYVTPGSNFIRFKGDEVEIFLPYFGVRHTGGGYGSEGGIKYEGSPNELRIDNEIGKDRIAVFFRGKHEGEDLQFHITLFSNGKADILVNSTQRNSISYEGEIKRLLEGDNL